MPKQRFEHYEPIWDWHPHGTPSQSYALDSQTISFLNCNVN